jgi:uncharacterized repeat protein (TIGR03803 family)
MYASEAEMKIVWMSTRVEAAVLVALALLTARGGAAQTFGTIYSFKGTTDGSAPNGVIFGKNGSLYGTTGGGGSNGSGTVFELTPVKGAPWTKTVLLDFDGPDGALPSFYSKLALGGNGALYGTTMQGGSGDNGGTVFELAPPATAGGAWTETVLNSLPGYTAMRVPYGPVAIGSGGALYATATANEFAYSASAGGAVFMLTPPSTPGDTWTESTLVSFWPLTALGQGPESGVVSVGGSLYGTNSNYGESCGTVFELSPPGTVGGAWTATVISSFDGGGCGPIAAPTVGSGGVLYVATYAGGSGACNFQYGPLAGCGAVVQLTPPATAGGAWTEAVIYSFTGLDGDGMYPQASVVLGKDGVLYGTTNYGGSATSGSPCTGYGATSTPGPIGCGTVFQLTPPATPGGVWTETILHSFTGQDGEGSVPGPLTINADGVLFGPTFSGGGGAGTIFALEP